MPIMVGHEEREDAAASPALSNRFVGLTAGMVQARLIGAAIDLPQGGIPYTAAAQSYEPQ